jgi:UDP-N-acetylmuramoyl-L-alanyl-D-glutamate--2,6-diaminopimelate ligase
MTTLDYHGTFAEYIKAKKRFFDQLPATAFALVNADDANSAVMLAEHQGYQALLRGEEHGRPPCPHHREPTHRPALNIDGHDMYSRLIGEFNASNLLAYIHRGHVARRGNL